MPLDPGQAPHARAREETSASALLAIALPGYAGGRPSTRQMSAPVEVCQDRPMDHRHADAWIEVFGQLLGFLNRLDSAHVHYALAHTSLSR
jgi:hypothetical protein